MSDRPALLTAARAAEIRAGHPELVGRLLEAANAARECRFAYFGYPEVSLARPDVDWNYDPIADFHWPQLPSARIPWRSVPADVKWVWELNRLQHLPLLAEAWLFTGDSGYAAAAFEQLDSWLTQSPPGQGIAWYGGFEAGVRAISVLLTLDGLAQSPLLTPERFRSISSMLAASARRCWANRSLFSSANNHLIGEMAGLATTAIMLPGLKDAQRWESRAVDMLVQEVDRLIHPDGSGAEQSITYQVFTSELLLVVAVLLQRRDGKAPPELIRGIARSADYLADLVGQTDPAPRYGDDDNSLAFRLGHEPVRVVREHLAIVGSFLGDGSLLRLTQPSLASAWLASDHVSEGRSQYRPNFYASDGGLVVLRSQERRITMDVAPLGHLSIAAHGHADALGLTLTDQGRELITDPGTGSYYGHPDWRTVHRGTRAHATVRVDGLDQSSIGGPFLWTKHARAEVHAVNLDAGIVDASHDGYRRLKVVHRRWLYAPPEGRSIVVIDWLAGMGNHEAELSWPLAPDLDALVTTTGHRVDREGRTLLALDYAASSPFELSAVRGDTATGLGWWSDQLESRRPTWLVGLKATAQLPLAIVTVLTLNPDGHSVGGLGVNVTEAGITASWMQDGERTTIVADPHRNGSVIDASTNTPKASSTHVPRTAQTTEQTVPSGLRKKVGKVAGAAVVGLVIAQAISIAQTIALARLLGPYQVGLFAAGSVLMVFMANLVEGGMRTALIQRRDSVKETTETVFWATLLSGLAMSVLALASAPLIGLLFRSREIGLVAAAIAPTMLLFALSSVPDALLQREFSVRRRLIVAPAVSAAFAAVSVSCAVFGLGVWSLVLGTYAQCAALLLTTWALCGWRPGTARPSYRLWRELARFGFPLTIEMMLTRSRDVVFRVVIERSLGTATLGQYRYGERLAQIPFLAVLEVGSYALLPAFSRVAHDADRLRRVFLDALRWGSLGGVAAAGLLIALGEQAVVILLGNEWRAAGMVAVTMAGLGLGASWSAAGGEALSAAGRTVRQMNTTLITVVTALVLLISLVGPLGVRGVGLSISAAQLLSGAMLLAAARKVVGVKGKRMMRTIAPSLLAGIASGGLIYVFDHFVARADQRSAAVGLLTLAGEALLFSVMYLVLCALLDPAVKSGLAHARRILGRWMWPARFPPVEDGQ